MKNILLALSILLIFSCKTKQASTTTDNQVPVETCQTKATVIDMKNLDGCQFLLQVENGEKWLPMEISDPDFKFQDQQVIFFDYEEVTDYMSICMAENKGVNITCIKASSKASNLPPACTEVPNLLKTNWIQQIIRDKKIWKITQYKDNSEYVYLFKTNAKSYLYDCKGALICELSKNTENDCSKKLKTLSNQYVIWVQNH